MKNIRHVSVFVLFSVLTFGASTAFAATAPSLGIADTFGVLSNTFTPSVGTTDVIGDLGYTTLSAGTFTVSGATHTDLSGSPAGAIYQQAGSDQLAALNGAGGLNAQACTLISGALDAVIIGTNLAGTFPPGCYETTGAMNITLDTTVTLDGTASGGTGNVWIFRSSGALNTGDNSFVTLTNGATASNVFWAPIGLTTLGAYTATGVPPLVPTFVGNILDAAGISLGHFANLSGRALAFGGTVTTDTNTITATPAPAACTGVVGTSVFVSTSGSDSNNDGSEACPFATIQAAINDANTISGDTIYVSAGNYTEQVNITKAITLTGAGKDITHINTPEPSSMTIYDQFGSKSPTPRYIYIIVVLTFQSLELHHPMLRSKDLMSI